MDINCFWDLIERSKIAGGTSADARTSALQDILQELSVADLHSFVSHYNQRTSEAFRWNLWGAAYIINGGCSDDGFHYFISWLISEGRQTFETALVNPETLAELPKVDLAENEGFEYAALKLLEKAGLEREPHINAIQSLEPVGDRWDEDAVYEIYPRLAAKYGE